MHVHANKRRLDHPVALFDNRLIAVSVVSVRVHATSRDYFQLFHVRPGLYPWQSFSSVMKPLFQEGLKQYLSKQHAVNVCYADVVAPVTCSVIIQDTWRLLSVLDGVVLFYELIGGQYNGKEEGALLHQNSMTQPRINYSFWDCGAEGIFMVMISFANNQWTLFGRKIQMTDVKTVIAPGNRVFLNSSPKQQ